ncbi:TetR/AcrR family transcriptional regulator [Mycobacterium sp. Lab-001]|uniref:TetR/AcrR family transcriptional regulator n=1 Tax=Mycobacterium sp. Lab-001 TaxID=3410136 RepID=UPI003D16C891
MDHHGRQQPAPPARQARRRPQHPHGVLRRRRPPAQHGLLRAGSARASAAVITKRAGVSVGALFGHFETMGDFMAATASEVLRRQLETFSKRVAGIHDAARALPGAESFPAEAFPVVVALMTNVFDGATVIGGGVLPQADIAERRVVVLTTPLALLQRADADLRVQRETPVQ